MKDAKPEIGARFVLGPGGKPEFTESEGLRHYVIELYFRGAEPRTESITYKLDASYYDPVREVFRSRRGADFAERITSYGDYEISASPSGVSESRSSARVTETRSLLSKALERSVQEQAGATPALQEALEYIRKH